MTRRIVELIVFYAELLKAYIIEVKKKAMKDEVKSAIDNHNTKPLEDNPSDSDNSSSHIYDGMYIRPKKDRSKKGNLVD